MENIQLEITTPEQTFLQEEAFMIIIPGANGELGILSQHSSLIALLKPGLVKVYSSENEIKKKIFVYGGFAEIAGNKLIILTDNAIYQENIEQKIVQKELEQHKIELQSAATNFNTDLITKDILVKEAMLEALTEKAS